MIRGIADHTETIHPELAKVVERVDEYLDTALPDPTSAVKVSPSEHRTLRAHAAQTRVRADQFAAVLEDIAANGLPDPEPCIPVGGPARDASGPARRPAPSRRLMPPHPRSRRARIVFSDAAAKQLEAITSETELHALARALVVISVGPETGDPLPAAADAPARAAAQDTTG